MKPQSTPFPDFYHTQSLLNDEQKLVECSVREFVEKEAQPLIRTAYRDGDFPKSLIPGLGELGVLGANLTGYGLPGMDQISYGLVMKELERCDSGLRSFVSVF